MNLKYLLGITDAFWLQGEMINRIEFNVNNCAENIEKGLDEVEQAAAIVNRGRWVNSITNKTLNLRKLEFIQCINLLKLFHLHLGCLLKLNQKLNAGVHCLLKL